MECTKTALGRLWCRAGEPVPIGKYQSGNAQEMYQGRLSFQQASIPIRDELYLPLLRALIQKLSTNWCLLVCIPFVVGLRQLRAMQLILSISLHNGQCAEVEDFFNLVALVFGKWAVRHNLASASYCNSSHRYQQHRACAFCACVFKLVCQVHVHWALCAITAAERAE
eukprot:1139848-Pelagomonas_calceolata.AAC.1